MKSNFCLTLCSHPRRIVSFVVLEFMYGFFIIIHSIPFNFVLNFNFNSHSFYFQFSLTNNFHISAVNDKIYFYYFFIPNLTNLVFVFTLTFNL